ncbi:MAG: TSUP family transporter [Syntrophales bacterium]
MLAASYILLGLVAGILGGLIGIGGGTIIVPALVLFFGMSQHLPGDNPGPTGPADRHTCCVAILQKGYVDLHVAGLICLGFVMGGLAGAKMATGLSNTVLEKVFGAALLLISLKMIFAK